MLRHAFRGVLAALTMLLALSPCASAQGATGVTFLSLLTGPMNSWGDNRRLSYAPPATTFQSFAYSYSSNAYVDHVENYMWGPNSQFWLVFFDSANMKAPLQPGVYENFDYLGSSTPGRPTFSIGGNGVGGLVNSGSFTVYEAVFEDTPNGPATKRFAASFEGFRGPWSDPGQLAIRGTFAYNSLSTAVPEPGALALAGYGAIALLCFRPRRARSIA
ncbi:MAG TPA: PEP-CTERM sorting domain-containing protein [Armatimonadota bacterium]|jgi:hypothetical protein